MINELERIRKKVVVTSLKVALLSWHCMKELIKTMTNLSKDSWSLGQELQPGPKVLQL
jgi:hypothetical protein